MTISSEVRKAGPFTGNGTTATFPFSFKAFADKDLEVIKLAAGSAAEQVLVLDSDYSADLNPDQDSSPGGSIQLLAGPLASGDTLVITTDIPEVQETDVTNGGGFYPEVITEALDYLTILVQQLQITVESSLRFPMSDSESLSPELPPAAQRANRFLSFDNNGNPTASVSPGYTAALSRVNGTISGSVDGSNRTFILSVTPGYGPLAILSVAGSIIPHELYTISGNTLTINTPLPPQRGDTIELYCS